MYYIIREDGSSIFEQAYPEDFIFHCLINLLDRTNERLSLLSFGSLPSEFISLSAEKNLAAR